MSRRKCMGLMAALVLLACQRWALGELERPSITKVEIKYWESPHPVVEIIGSGFGSVQGTKNIKIDGDLFAGAPSHFILFWLDKRVQIHGIPVIPWEHTYEFAITEGSTVISNVWTGRFLYEIESISPDSGVPRSPVKVTIWGLPKVQGQYALKLGSHVFPVLTWGTPIDVEVPAVPAGRYEVCLLTGSALVSNKVPFDVLVPPVKIKR